MRRDIMKGKKSYVGSKWGKYLRAPEIFFTILEKGNDIFTPLTKIAHVTRGFTTGANAFFYLTEEEIKKRKIEKEFWMHKDKDDWVPNYLLKSPKEIKSVIVNLKDLKYRVLMIDDDKKDLEGKAILKYIEWGEEQGFHERPTCTSRKPWYKLTKLPIPHILFRQFFDATFNFPLHTFDIPTDHTFYYLCLRDENAKLAKAFAAMFNSTLYSLITELYARTTMGQGVLIAYGPEIRPIPTINLSEVKKVTIKKLEKMFDILAKRQISHVFDEIGAETPDDVLLENVKSDRIKLDEIVMGDILGLTKNEQLEVYVAIIDLVKSRKEKAESVRKRKKIKGIDLDLLSESILEDFSSANIRRFPKEYIGDCECREITVPKGQVEIGSDLNGFFVIVGGQEIRCDSSYLAIYIQYAVMNGHTRIELPIDNEVLRKAVEEYKPQIDETRENLNAFLESLIPDKKLRRRIYGEVWQRILKGSH